MEAGAASWKPTESWPSHPAYARYWRHYYQAMAWMRSHHHAYRKAVESYVRPAWGFPPAAFPQASYAGAGRPPQCVCGPPSASQRAPCAYAPSPRGGQHPYGSTREAQAPAAQDEEEEAEEEGDSDSDEGVECDLSNMEIPEELRQYFAETERHREERRRQRQLDEERLEGYVSADQDLRYSTNRSAEPPAHRPGERRQAELQRWYGEGAAQIQALEAAVQLSFHKYLDRKRPKYWPVIPLKF